MKKMKTPNFFACAALVTIVTLLLVPTAFGQDAIPNRTPDGQPDIQGVWTNFDRRPSRHRAQKCGRTSTPWRFGFPESTSRLAGSKGRARSPSGARSVRNGASRDGRWSSTHLTGASGSCLRRGPFETTTYDASLIRGSTTRRGNGVSRAVCQE